MKFISTINFKIKEIVSEKASKLQLNLKYAILPKSIDVPEYIYIECIVLSNEFETHNTIEFPIVLSITEKDHTTVDDAIADASRRSSFIGFRIKLVCDFNFAIENLNNFVLQCNADNTVGTFTTEDSEAENGNVTKTSTVLLNRINQSDFDGIKSLIDTYIELTTIDNDSIETIVDGKYKYIVPNNAV